MTTVILNVAFPTTTLGVSPTIPVLSVRPKSIQDVALRSNSGWGSFRRIVGNVLLAIAALALPLMIVLLAMLPIIFHAQKSEKIGFYDTPVPVFETQLLFTVMIVAFASTAFAIPKIIVRRHPDEHWGVLRYAGISQSALLRLKRDGLDIKKTAAGWKENNPDSGVGELLRFTKTSAWQRRAMFRKRVKLLSQNRKTKHITELLLAVGTPDDAVSNQDLKTMMRLWTQGVDVKMLGSASENDIDFELAKWIVRNEN